MSGPKLMSNDYIKMTTEELDMHKRLDKMIDISKPLIPQVKKMSNVEFMAFVRRPRQLDDQDGIILFENDDEGAKRDLDTNLLIILPVILVYLVIAFYNAENYVHFLKNFAAWFSFGLFGFWTWMEYFQHRFVLHKELNLDPNEPWSEAAGERNAGIFQRHVHHHVFMNQKFRIVLDMKSYCLYNGTLLPIFIYLGGPVMAFNGAAGMVIGSLLYDFMHMAYHFPEKYGNFEWSWFQKMKSAHMRHHFRDNSREFGVTTEFWDIVHGTTKRDIKEN